MQRTERRATYDRVAASALRAWLRATSKLSLGNVQRLGRAVGDCAFFSGGTLRQITRANLLACYPSLARDDLNRMTRDSLRQTGCYAAELGIAWANDARWKDLIAGVIGADVVEKAAADAKPTLVLAPHFGNWEFLSLYLGGRLPLLILYESPRIASLESILAVGRARTGCTVLPLGSNGLRQVLIALRNNQAVALLPDQVPSPQSGEYAPFFGRAALTMTLAYRLIERFQANVVLAHARRLPEAQGFQLCFERLSTVECARNSAESLAAMNAAIERVIAQDPTQYQWEYRRFRRPKTADEKLY